jgi:hypothetical protein
VGAAVSIIHIIWSTLSTSMTKQTITKIQTVVMNKNEVVMLMRSTFVLRGRRLVHIRRVVTLFFVFFLFFSWLHIERSMCRYNACLYQDEWCVVQGQTYR